MTAIPYMQFYPGDFLSATEDLSNEEVGAYIRILAYSWRKKRALLNDPVRITRLLRCTKGRWFRKLLPVLMEFFERDEDGSPKGGALVQKRLEIEREKAEKTGKKSPKKEPENPSPSRGGAKSQSIPSSSEEDRGGRGRAPARGTSSRSPIPENFKDPGNWIGEAFAKRKAQGLPEVNLDLAWEKWVRSSRAKGLVFSDRYEAWMAWALAERPANGGGNGRGDKESDDEQTRRRRAGLAAALAADMDGGGFGSSRDGEADPDWLGGASAAA